MTTRSEQFEKVDALLRSWDTTQSPGCTLAVIENGEIIYTRGYGMANLEHGISNQPWTRFYLASMSKQFTAFCIALLEEDGKLDLQDDIRKYVPEIPQYPKTITVEHLVHHTSGLRDYLSLGAMAGHPMDDLITEEQALELLARQKELNFLPGEEYLYSNSGYILMSMIVARVSGKSFRQYADEMIFQPLGMKHTHVHDNHLQPVPQRATGYAPSPHGYEISVPNFDVVGDGGIYSNVLDLYKWDQNFYHNILGRGRPELIERVLSTRKLNNGEENNYAFGLVVDRYKGVREVQHSGGYGGYRTEMIRYPEQNFSVALLSNHAGLQPVDMARQVAEIFLGDEFAKSGASTEKPAFITLPKADLQNLAGMYYSSENGLSVEITLKDGGLLANIAGAFSVHFHPVSSKVFVSEDKPAPRQMVFSEAGLSLSPGSDKAMPLKRLNVQTLAPQEMEPLCGVFISEELDAKCRIELRDGQLIYKIGSRTERLKPVSAGMYLYSGGALFVDQNTAGPAKGFKLQEGRVRGIRFSRLS